MGRFLYPLLALALLGGACLATLVAATWRWLACENEGTEACSRADLADAQFVVACIGLVPAALLVVTTIRLGRRSSLAVLAVGLVIYAVWALLLDAAIHGWDDLKLIPS